MSKRDSVYDLIKSLNKPEKRHFKLFAARYKQNGEKKYLKIFQAFDQLKQPDSEALRKKLNRARYNGNLAGDKHYLYELLLSSLRQYHIDSTVEGRLSNELLSATVLRHKGLFQPAARVLRQVRKEAARYELFELQLFALRMEQDLRWQAFVEQRDFGIELIDDADALLKRIEMINKLERQRIEMGRLMPETGHPQTEEERERWRHYLDYFLSTEYEGESVTEKLLRLRTTSLCHFALQEFPAAAQVNRIRYDLLKQHPEQVEKNPRELVVFLQFSVTISVLVQQYEEALAFLEEMRNLQQRFDESRYPHVHLEVTMRYLPMVIYVNGMAGNFTRIIERETEAERFLEQHAEQMPKMFRSSFLYNIASAFMTAGNYRRVIRWTHRALNQYPVKTNVFTHFYNLLLQVIAHIELDDLDVAQSRATAASRYIRQHKPEADRIDLRFITMLQKCASTYDHDERRHYAAAFLEQDQKALEQFFVDRLVFRDWVYRTAGKMMDSSAG